MVISLCVSFLQCFLSLLPSPLPLSSTHTPVPFILKTSCVFKFLSLVCLFYVVLSGQVLLQFSAKIVGIVEHLNLEIQLQFSLPETPALSYSVGF